MRVYAYAVVLSITVSLLLVGCGSLPSRIESKEGFGHLIFSHRLNDSGISQYEKFRDYEYYDVIEVKRIDARRGDNVYSLTRWKGAIGGESIYMGSLPEGRYRLTEGRSEINEYPISYSVDVPIHPELGEFEVFANTITDLGVITSSLATVDDEWVSLHARLPVDRDLDVYVRRFLEETGQEMPLEGKVSWVGSASGSYNLTSIEHARRNPHFTGAEFLDSAGRLVLTSTLGDLAVRDPSGNWHRVPTGSKGRLWTVAESDRGFFVGGAFGLVLHNDDLYEGEWEALPELSPHSDVVHLVVRENILYAIVIDREIGMARYQRRAGGPSVERFYPSPSLVLYRTDMADINWDVVNRMNIPVQLHFSEAVVAGENVLIKWASELWGRAGIHRVNIASGEIEPVREGNDIRGWELGPFDEESFLTYRPTGFGARRNVVISNLEDAQSTDVAEEALLGQIYFRQKPVVLEDGRMVVFGGRSLKSESGNDVYHRLENATVEKDGLQVPYDPAKGTYFVSDEEEGWVPFAIPPRPCISMQGMIAVGDRLIQCCRFGPNHSVRVGERDWVAEESSSSLLPLESGR